MSVIKKFYDKKFNSRGVNQRIFEAEVDRLFDLKKQGWSRRKLVTEGGFHGDFVKFYISPSKTYNR